MPATFRRVALTCALLMPVGCDNAKPTTASSPHTSAAADATKRIEKEQFKANVERVLKLDASTNGGSEGAAAVARRMHAIDTTGCPDEFRAAYLAHVYAWDSMADVQREARSVQTESESDAALLESFLRGALGDPLGKANEIKAAQARLKRDAQAASLEIKKTFQRVQELAISYGANPNQEP